VRLLAGAPFGGGRGTHENAGRSTDAGLAQRPPSDPAAVNGSHTIIYIQCHEWYDMVTVVAIDKAGRIVIPKETRDAQGIRPGTRFLLVEGRGGEIWLQRLDPEELARRIRDELRAVDLDPIIEKVQADIERIAAERYPAAARHRT